MEKRGTSARRGLAAAIAALLTTAVLSPGAAAVVIGQDPGAVCVSGWATAGAPSPLPGATAVDVAVQSGTQWVAGSEMQEGRNLVAFAARATTLGWSNVPLASTSSQTVLTAISADGPNALWAAGERVGGAAQTQPLIEHWNGSNWTQGALPTLPNGGVLSDIAQVGQQVAVAVGFGADLSGQHAVGYAWTRGQWQLAAPPLTGFSALTAVSAAPDSTTWAVGWVQTLTGYRPLLEQWTNSGWRRATMTGSGSIVLTGVTVLSKTSAWAVGFRELPGSLSGVAAHWNGKSWTMESGLSIPAAGGSILRDVAMVGGNVTAVGMSWDQSSKDSVPVVAERTLTGWSVQSGVAGITGGELLGIGGGENPIAVGRTGGRAVAIVPCTPGHSPSGDRGSPIGAAPGNGALAGGSSTDAATARGGDPARAAVDAALPAGAAAHLPQPNAARPTRVPRVVRRQLPSPEAVPGLQVQDVTKQAGLTNTTLTYNGTSADFNGDGWPDLVIGRHARPLWLLLNQGDGTFETVANGFRQADRHGCAVGSIDRDPRAEIVCAVGANHGLSVKDNEVWLNPLDPSATNAADALGLADPLGRGRRTALLDYNHDGLTDVYFANDPSRPDSLPGSNHLFRNVDGSSFTSAPEAGLDLGVGAECLIAVDIDRDGWPDIIDCEYIQMATYAALHIFRNNHGVFTDATARFGMDGDGIFDAEAGDLNHDGRVDLVTLSLGRLDVWIQANGTFHHSAAYWVPNVSALTLADVNGDGKQDIYILRGQYGGGPVQDVLLLNNGTGLSYRSVQLPSAQPGPGGDAFPIDFDRNGKQDILVMHGSNREEGPIQLLAFGPPWPFGAPGATESPSAAPPSSPVPTTSPGAVSSPAGSPSIPGPSPTAVTPSASVPAPSSTAVAPIASGVAPSPSGADATPPRATPSSSPKPTPSGPRPSQTPRNSTRPASPSPKASPGPRRSPGATPRGTPQATVSPNPSATASPSPAAPTPRALPSPSPSPSGSGSGATGNGGGGSSGPIAMDETGIARTITLGALGIVGLVLLSFQLLRRRDRRG